MKFRRVKGCKGVLRTLYVTHDSSDKLNQIAEESNLSCSAAVSLIIARYWVASGHTDGEIESAEQIRAGQTAEAAKVERRATTAAGFVGGRVAELINAPSTPEDEAKIDALVEEMKRRKPGASST